MAKVFKTFIITYVATLSIVTALYISAINTNQSIIPSLYSEANKPTSSPIPSPKPILQTPPPSKILKNNYHIFQTFNNCGPAALSMILSYFDISENQNVLGQALRPYQNPQGDNDDKSVTLEELGEKSREYGFVTYHRSNGNMDMLKLFITHDIPIIARTWTKMNENIGHYRIVKGYNEETREIIQDDSLQGKNLHYSYENFNLLWEKFNYEYLVLVSSDKVEIVQAILGNDVDEKTAWKKAANNSENEIKINPNPDLIGANDIHSRFNLSVALYNIGEYQRSVEEFEKVQNDLPFRTLWYQIEPILAYYELGNYNRVFEITDRVLNNYNRAFSELYILRGKIYQKQGNLDLARVEFEKAVFYNVNLKSAQKSLMALN